MKRKEKAVAYIKKQRETYIVLRNNLDKNMRNYQKLKRQCNDMISILDYILIKLL